MDENNEKWQSVIDTFKELLSTVEYTTWFKSLKFVKVDNNNIYLEVKNDVVRKLLNKRYHDLILETISLFFGDNYNYVINLAENQPISNVDFNKNQSNNMSINSSNLFKNNNNYDSNLNNKFTFDSFIVGGSNKLAFDASMNVASNPGNTYNPLYIYGNVGLGKTHLMQAIGNYIKENMQDKKVLYVSSEKFLSDFLQAVRFQKDTSQFREKYRNVDVLLIDDIQFFINKPETQEEFFHTFNELYDDNKQIILTSDKAPQEIDNLEERLKSRFEMGLVVDIQSPNIETRMAIINEKANLFDSSVTIPNEVVEFIAEGIPSNVRKLEGAVNKIIMYSKMTMAPISISLAKEALKDIINQKPSTLNISYIQDVVSNYYGLTSDDLKAKKRSKEIANARQVAMYLSRKLTDESFPRIGEEFGRDHSTVIHAYDKVDEDIKTSKEFKETIDLLVSKLKSI